MHETSLLSTDRPGDIVRALAFEDFVLGKAHASSSIIVFTCFGPDCHFACEAYTYLSLDGLARI